MGTEPHPGYQSMFASTKELLDEIRLGESAFLECSEVRFSGARGIGPREDVDG